MIVCENYSLVVDRDPAGDGRLLLHHGGNTYQLGFTREDAETIALGIAPQLFRRQTAGEML